MTTADISDKLRNVTSELRELHECLLTAEPPNTMVLQEFRTVLDSIRISAWTVSELLNARQSTINPQAALSFQDAERVRRFAETATNLCTDIEKGHIAVQAHEIRILGAALHDLLSRLNEKSALKKA